MRSAEQVAADREAEQSYLEALATVPQMVGLSDQEAYVFRLGFRAGVSWANDFIEGPRLTHDRQQTKGYKHVPSR